MHFWAQGYFISTVGADEGRVLDYIKRQEKKDARLVRLFEDE
jgi:putative transposase